MSKKRICEYYLTCDYGSCNHLRLHDHSFTCNSYCGPMNRKAECHSERNLKLRKIEKIYESTL